MTLRDKFSIEGNHEVKLERSVERLQRLFELGNDSKVLSINSRKSDINSRKSDPDLKMLGDSFGTII